MKIYNAHPETREYIGEGFADPDPLDIGNWLIPAYAYKEPPPIAGLNEVVRRDKSGTAWELVPDFRGTVYYVDSPTPHVIEEIGVTIPQDSTSTPPTPCVDPRTSLMQELEQIDRDSVRTIRMLLLKSSAVEEGTEEHTQLGALEAQAATIWAQLAALDE